MKPVITILWRVSGWKGFSVVACGHLHARPETYPLTDFQCWCERPFFDSSRVAAATRQDPADMSEECRAVQTNASPSLPIEKETR